MVDCLLTNLGHDPMKKVKRLWDETVTDYMELMKGIK